MPVGGKGSDVVNFLICGGLNVVLGGGVKELPSSMWDISAALSMGTLPLNELVGHSGEYGNAAKLVGKMSKSVMRLMSIHF